MYERDYESVITSRPYLSATSLIYHSYTVIKQMMGKVPLKNSNHRNPF